MKRLILLLLLVYGFSAAKSQQIRQFTADTIIYIEEIKKFTTNYISPGDSKILDKFIDLWQNGGLTWNEMSAIADNSTLLVRKNGRASPHFIQYFEIINIFSEPDYNDVGISEWQKAFSYLLNDRNSGVKALEQLLKSSLSLLKNNELFNLPGNIWKGYEVKYRFTFQDDILKIDFEPFDLRCYSKRDSITVFNTSGVFYPMENIFHGKQGLVTWERAQISRDEVFVKLGDFKIDLRKSEYSADSVLFTYRKYLDTPLLGRIEEKVMLVTDPDRTTYPKFFSYQNKYILPQLFRDIEYTGGLSMQGARLIGTGSIYEPAVLMVFDNGAPRIRFESQQLLFTESTVNSPNVKTTLFIENDSLTHPDLQFIFNEKTDEIKLIKSRSFTSASPFTNTYHQMDMNFEEFYWKRSERFIRFRPLTGTSIGIATFESNSFFNYRVFEELQGMDRINPLVALWQFGRMTNLDKFSLSNYAGYLGMPAYQVRQQLMRLSRLGFVYYDDESDIITIRPKLQYFIDSSVGNVDYDVILFSSRTQSPLENALLNLDDLDLTINGIQHISISDSQNVVLLPTANRIIMKRNKSFQFDGVVHAGLFSFFGNNFFFNYDEFKLNMQHIDSISLAVNTGKTDNYGRMIAEKINNLLEDATGELLIDDPDNKSGLRSFPQYPTFNSNEYSYVYFDEIEIQNGVYPREDVYFKVDPFRMDSLDNFLKEGLRLTGQFASGGILPPIDQTLVLMSDNSLGFTHRVQEQGIPVYEGKGTFYQQIELSNKGLRGAGKLEYLTSTTFSDDIIFHPDSLMTRSRDFTIDKQYTGTEFPGVKSKNNPIKWLVKQDKFNASKEDIPFTMFADTILMHGDIILQPSGLTGRGNLDMVSASLESPELIFKADRVSSDSSDFKLKSPALNKLALTTTNVRSNIDFSSFEGEFIPNEGFAQVEFPENRYISILNYFLWLMDEEQLHMGLDKPVDSMPGYDELPGPRYISVHPAQDSLSFASPMAVYEYTKFIIKATEVQYIQVADARIFPSDGLVVVEPNARIQPLIDARILADYTSQYFNLYDATVNINGKNDYTATAKYDYFDLTGRKQVMNFNSVRVDGSLQTIGSAEITLLDNFMLSPYFEYQGRVELASKSPLLYFDGATRIIHSCDVGKAWLKFKSEIDPQNVMIPVTETPVDINLSRIFAGIMLTRDSAHVYTTFSSGRKDYFDNYIATANGFLTYDIPNNWYEIAALDKLSDSTKNGNYLRFNTYPCQTYSEGKIDYLVNYGQLKIKAFGKSFHDMENDNFTTDGMLAFDFFFSEDALSVFAAELDSLQGLLAYDLTSPVYRLALQELVGPDKAQTMNNDMTLYGTYREIPEEFKKTIVLSNVKLKWNMNTRSFRYHGDVGIIRVGDNLINKQAEAYIELSKRASGDLLDIYFVFNDRIWYYFGYNPGSFQVTSSNSKFNNIVFDIKDTQRRIRVKPGESGYIYSLGPERRAQLFLRRYLEE